MKEIKAELWSIKICDGVLDMVHSNFRYIKEFYIPKYNVTFNCENDIVHIFRPDKQRYSCDETKTNNSQKIEDLTVSESLCELLADYLRIKENTETKVKNFIEKRS